jgi:hypothetical protein
MIFMIMLNFYDIFQTFMIFMICGRPGIRLPYYTYYNYLILTKIIMRKIKLLLTLMQKDIFDNISIRILKALF